MKTENEIIENIVCRIINEATGKIVDIMTEESKIHKLDQESYDSTILTGLVNLISGYIAQIVIMKVEEKERIKSFNSLTDVVCALLKRNLSQVSLVCGEKHDA